MNINSEINKLTEGHLFYYLASPMMVNELWLVCYSVVMVSVTQCPLTCCNCLLWRTLSLDGSARGRPSNWESRWPRWVVPLEEDRETLIGLEPWGGHGMYQYQDISTSWPSLDAVSVALSWGCPEVRSFRYWTLMDRWRLVSVFARQSAGTWGGMEAVERRDS